MPDPASALLDTDEKRRVLANLPRWRDPATQKDHTEQMLALDTLSKHGLSEAPQSKSLSVLAQDVVKDEFTDVWSLESVRQVVEDLQAVGLVSVSDDEVVQMTELGFEALTGPIPNEPQPLEGKALQAAQLMDEVTEERAAAQLKLGKGESAFGKAKDSGDVGK